MWGGCPEHPVLTERMEAEWEPQGPGPPPARSLARSQTIFPRDQNLAVSVVGFP